MQEKLPSDNRIMKVDLEETSSPRNSVRKTVFIASVFIILFVLGTILFFNWNKLARFFAQDQTRERVVSQRVQDEDMDNDGLLDAEEEKLGLSSQDFDTDGDGIPDKMEIDRFKTDPVKADTDGDGFADGFEIINGFNPLGEGTI